jgi:glutamine synthetase
MAEELSRFADRLERSENFREDLANLLHETFKAHQRIIFDGNGYGDAWVEEAKRRGLANLRDTVDCMPAYIDPKNVELFTKHGILTMAEMHARYEIHLENYCKVTTIESNTLLDMVQREILPAVIRYADELSVAIFHKNEMVGAACTAEKALVKRISTLTDELYDLCTRLKDALANAPAVDGGIEAARYFRDQVFACQNEICRVVSELESCTSSTHWPYPTYADILFSV